MNRYYFIYTVKLPSGDLKELSFGCEASRLSSAIKFFYLSSKNFAYPVHTLNPRYGVVNRVGVMTSRLLPAKYLTN